MNLTAEVDEILALHHEPARAAMKEITLALRQAPIPLRQDWAALTTLFTDHLGKEEILLFPAIHALDRGQEGVINHILGPIAQMHMEHHQLASFEGKLRAALPQAGPAENQLRAFLDDLVVHATREDERLFPHALARALDKDPSEIDLNELVGGVQDRSGDPVGEARPRPTPTPEPRRKRGIRARLKKLLRG